MRIDYPSKPLLLWAFAFIASQIFKRSPDDDPSIFPEAYDVTYEEIAEQCGVSKMTAIKLMSLLEENQLLCVYHSNTATRFGDQFFKIPNIYARFGQEQELKYKLEQLDSRKEKENSERALRTTLPRIIVNQIPAPMVKTTLGMMTMTRFGVLRSRREPLLTGCSAPRMLWRRFYGCCTAFYSGRHKILTYCFKGKNSLKF